MLGVPRKLLQYNSGANRTVSAKRLIRANVHPYQRPVSNIKRTYVPKMMVNTKSSRGALSND